MIAFTAKKKRKAKEGILSKNLTSLTFPTAASR